MCKGICNDNNNNNNNYNNNNNDNNINNNNNPCAKVHLPLPPASPSIDNCCSHVSDIPYRCHCF